MRVTQKKLTQWILEGRGQGHEGDYTPWLLIKRNQSPTGGSLQYRHVPQLNRYLHLLSKGELHVARFLLWLGVLDLRDQFPCWPWPHEHPLYMHPRFQPQVLPWSEGTLACAKDLGIRHPNYPGTSIPYVPTFDMLVTVPEGVGVRAVSISVKPGKEELAISNESLEKLAIQREYSVRLEIPWRSISGALIPPSLSSNLTVCIHYSGPLDELSGRQWGLFIQILNEYISPSLPINQALKAVETEMRLPRNLILTFFYRALWFRRTKIDLRQPVVMSVPPELTDYSWISSTVDYILGEQT